MVQLNQDQLLKAQEEIYADLQNKEADLLAVQSTQESVAIKWQKALEVLLLIQIEVVAKYGFAKDQMGLALFNQQFLQHAQKGSELYGLSEKKWSYILDKAFGVKELKEMSLEEAKSITQEMSQALTANDFLKQVEETMGSLPANMDIVEKRKKLLEMMLPLQKTIFEKHGFQGEQGYVQAQKALLDYLHVPALVQMSAYAQIILFRKAGLLSKETR